MKKLFFLVLALMLVFSLASISFAQAPVPGRIAQWEHESLSASTEVHAVVEPYASVQFQDCIPFLEFEGNEGILGIAKTDVVTLTVVRNSTVSVDISGTKLLQVADNNGTPTSPDTLGTAYGYSLTTNPTTYPAVASSTTTPTVIASGISLANKGTSDIKVGIKGTLGSTSIADQAAGSYKSFIYVTVSSSLHQPSYDVD